MLILLIFGNVLPTSLGIIILRNTHAYTYAFFIIIKIFKTTEGHSGYQFPWSPTTPTPFKVIKLHHNLHDLKFKGNYRGHYNFWYWLCGTNHPDYQKLLKNKKE